MGISRDWRHKRRATGGKRKAYRKKRKFEMGRPAANTKIGEKRIRLVRTRGGNTKYRALRLETGNFSWGSEAVTRKSRILNVVYNASNNELVRTNTLVKNCILQIDATPFRLHYENYYGVAPGKKRRISEKTKKTKTEKSTSDKAAAKKGAAKAKAPAKAGDKAIAKSAAKKGAAKAKAPAKAAEKGAAKKAAAKAKAPAKAGDKAIAKSAAKKAAPAKAKAPAKAGEKAEKAAAAKSPAAAAKSPAKAAAKVAKVSKAPKPKEADPSKPARKTRAQLKTALEAKRKARLVVKRKLQASHRKATGKLAENIIDQFSTGKLLVCVSSRPGQSGRCDGYVLEGKELDFYLRKIAQKKKAK